MAITIADQHHLGKTSFSNSGCERLPLIELLNNSENTKLLDSPLTNRKEHMDRLKPIIDQMSMTWVATFSKDISESQLLFIAGHLRSLSVDLEMEILNSLTPAERERVAKLAAYVLPSAIEEAMRNNHKYELGSAILDSRIRKAHGEVRERGVRGVTK